MRRKAEATRLAEPKPKWRMPWLSAGAVCGRRKRVQVQFALRLKAARRIFGSGGMICLS